MDQISAPAGRVQSPQEAQEGSAATNQQQQQQHQTPDALDAHGTHDTRMGSPQTDREARSNLNSAAGTPSRSPAVVQTTTPKFGLSSAPSSPSSRPGSPGSLATTAVASPGRPRDLRSVSRTQSPESSTMSLLVVLAKLAAFTDVFLSGLIIPLIPAVFQTHAHIPHQQVQIWISVFVSAHGGAFAAVSPLMPFLTRQGPTVYAVLIAGLVCSAAAFALLQASCDLSLLILARVIQGFAAAAITAASSALLATATGNGSIYSLSLLTPATIQSTAMATAPVVAGLLHDRFNADAVFYCAYALVAFNLVLSIVAINTQPIHRVGETDETAGLGTESEPAGYGTMASEAGGYSRRSSRSISPTSLPAAGLSQRPSPTNLATTPWSPRLVVALAGYFVVGLLTSALYGVLPLFVQRHLHWSVLTSGSMFAPLSAPAAVMGPFAGMLVARVPRLTRYLTAIGFFACIPVFIYLGQIWANKSLVEHGFLLTLSGLSLAIGLCGDSLAKEIVNAVGSSTRDPWSAAALATNLPTLANAWGSLAGPLFAGAISWLWGWQTMSISLAVVAAAAGVLSLLFLQGWIWNPYPDVYSQRLEPSSDEESAPLLANERSNRNLYGQPEGHGSRKDPFFRERQDSDDVSPHTRSEIDGKRRSHRRHFSVDNFSVATTTTPGSLDSSTSSVRFQAALETPVPGSAAKRPQTGDSGSKASAERRYVMREAPHASATDPLLAAGSLYVIDEERDTARGTERQRQKRRVVVFPEGSAPPELLARHRHHVVAINALDGTAQMVAESTDNHAVHVTEEDGDGEQAFEEGSSRRYVVVVVEGEDA